MIRSGGWWWREVRQTSPGPNFHTFKEGCQLAPWFISPTCPPQLVMLLHWTPTYPKLAETVPRRGEGVSAYFSYRMLAIWVKIQAIFTFTCFCEDLGHWKDISILSGRPFIKVLLHLGMRSDFLATRFQTKQQQYCFHSRYGYYYRQPWVLGCSVCFAQRLEQRNIYRCLSHEPMCCQSRELPSNAPGLSIVSFGWEPACYRAHSSCLRVKKWFCNQ